MNLKTNCEGNPGNTEVKRIFENKEVKKLSRKRNTTSDAAVPNDIESSTSHYEDTVEVLESEVLNQFKTANDTADSDRKNTKNSAEDKKLSRKKLNLEKEAKKNSRKRNQSTVVDSPNANVGTLDDTNISSISTHENTNENHSDGVSNKKKRTTKKPTGSDEKNNKKRSKVRKHPIKKQSTDNLPMLQVAKVKATTKQNEVPVQPGKSLVECSTIQTDEDPVEYQSTEEVSNKNKTSDDSATSDEKSAKEPVKDKISNTKGKKLNQLTNLQTEAKDNNDGRVNKNVQSAEVASVNNMKPNLETNEGSIRNNVEDHSNNLKKTKIPENSDKKNSNVSAIHGKLSLKTKKPHYPPTSQMVMEAIKILRKRNGASVDAILEYMQGKFKVNTKPIKRYVTRYINSAIQKGIIDKIGESGDNGRFKIKKAEKIAKNGNKYYQKKAKRARNHN